MEFTNQEIGRIGEKMANKFLKKRKYAILARNYITPLGEIDIVAAEKDFLVFFEVKTRISEKFGPPLASITEYKKRHIIRNCQYYLLREKLQDSPVRIDAIGITLDNNGNLLILKHVRNALQIQ
ncbi:MAG: YraN family protein [Candidatus Omnitrophica bacterium]|nr:YraN family protein [Candidatus Omnitrophota bacterium]